jgi:hypothetical protein
MWFRLLTCRPQELNDYELCAFLPPADLMDDDVINGGGGSARDDD